MNFDWLQTVWAASTVVIGAFLVAAVPVLLALLFNRITRRRRHAEGERDS